MQLKPQIILKLSNFSFICNVSVDEKPAACIKFAYAGDMENQIGTLILVSSKDSCRFKKHSAEPPQRHEEIPGALVSPSLRGGSPRCGGGSPSLPYLAYLTYYTYLAYLTYLTYVAYLA